MFVDEVTVHVRGGDGGAGVVSFQRLRGRPRGRPDGGSGGRGGDVVVAAAGSAATLLGYKRRPHRSAEAGAHGSGDMRHGRRGADLVLDVPLGTVVKAADGTVLADLVRDGQRVVVAGGGRGGRGNAGLAGPRNRAPGFAEQGEYGEDVTLTFEMKLLADAALVGFPNAGKSTLVSSVSAARPKVADYPFTTLEPHLGVVDVDGREFVLADIPGLVEGAADGKGLGHAFLRHVERARALVLLLDASPLQATGAVEQYEVLLAELEAHSPDLAKRPRVVALSKLDLPEVAAEAGTLERWAARRDVDLIPVSAVTGDGLNRLMHAVADMVDLEERAAPEREGFVLHRPGGAGFAVSRTGEGFEVTGRAAERAVALDDLTRPDAARFAARRLARLGVDDALAAAGAVAGDEVRIGDLVFEYQPGDDEGEDETAPPDEDGALEPPGEGVAGEAGP